MSAVVRPAMHAALEGAPYTDLWNAAHFAEDHAGLARYCSGFGWLIYDTTRWSRDETGEIFRLARDTNLRLYRNAINNHDKRLVNWAARSAFRPRLEAMVKLAESELGIAARADVFDRNPWLLNTASGIVDLKTGECRDHDPAALLTKLAPVFYSDAARCPIWLSTLDRIMGGNLDLIEYLQRAFGYSLTGDTSEQVMFVLWGTGANGKSTILETWQTILGDYAVQIGPETLMASRRTAGGVSPDLARLRGARFASSIETDEGRRLAEALVKAVTGGDRIVANPKYREPFEFRPGFKLWLATNHKPMIRGTDYAIWRRIRLIPFTVTIPAAERDKRLSNKLFSEGRGILRWAVDGALQWQRTGLADPPAVLAATDEYRAEMDPLADFVAERCIVAPHLKATDLYSAYAAWAKANGREVLDSRDFSARLQEKGHRYERKGGHTRYYGIGLAAPTGEAE